MLQSDLAIRVESEVVDAPKGSYNRPIYIFNCLLCGKELRVQKGGLGRHSGRCVKCVKRNRHPLQTLYNTFLTSVRRTNVKHRRNVSVSLTFEQFLAFTTIHQCYYCEGDVKWKEWGPGPYNLDRKDNDQGYSKENVVVCCFQCNQMKRNFYTAEEFAAVMKFLKEFRKTRSLSANHN